MPFLADHLWRNLVAGGEASVHLAGWPEVADARPRAARPRSPRCAGWSSSAGRRASSAGLKLRQPLRRIVVAGAAPRRAARRRDRRRAARQGGRVRRGRGLGAAREAEPAACSGRSSAPALPRGARGARRRDASSELDGRPLRGRAATCSSPTRCSSSGSAARAGRSRPTAASRSRSTRRSTTSCGSRRGCNDLIRAIQVLRKESGLEITDRIRLWIPDAELLVVRRADRRGDARGLGRARPELRLEKA